MSASTALPDELWAWILGLLPPSDLGRALCVSRSFASLSEEAWRASCYRRWPRWAALAEQAEWRKQFELLTLRESEVPADPAAIRKVQTNVGEGHRTILASWLCEVSFDWRLDTAIVHKAVAYLDAYLEQLNVEALGRFQLLGLGCLRAAMGDVRKRAYIKSIAEETDKSLDPERFAYISDNTYTAAEVEEFTQVVQALVPCHLKTTPSSKMFLRSFWHRAQSTGVVDKDEMHIYTLASFLLQLSLLDLTCSGYNPSLLAASAMSLSLTTFGKSEWPLPLQQFGAYTPGDLADCKARLALQQATQEALALRVLWREKHENHGYAEFRTEWDRMMSILSSRGQLPLPGAPATPALPAVPNAAEAMQID